MGVTNLEGDFIIYNNEKKIEVGLGYNYQLTILECKRNKLSLWNKNAISCNNIGKRMPLQYKSLISSFLSCVCSILKAFLRVWD